MHRLSHDIDIHTHTGVPRLDAILCVDPTQHTQLPEGEGFLSVGIHPWNADHATEEAWIRLKEWLKDKRVVAIGEIGLDRAVNVSRDVQMTVFIKQLQIADSLSLPVIIHCVRSFDTLLALRKQIKTTNQWIIHGFRGKPDTARQLLKAGFDLSFGTKFNIDSYDLTPPERRYHETDTDIDIASQ